MIWPGDRSKSWDDSATRAIVHLLGDTGVAGRLGRAVVEPGLALSAAARLEEDGAPGLLAVRATAAPGNIQRVVDRIREVLETTALGRFTSEDLEDIRSWRRVAMARERDDPSALAQGLLSVAGRSSGPPPEGLTLAELNDTARRLFKNSAPVALVTPGARPEPRDSAGREERP